MDSVNPKLVAHNTVDEDGNPTGGYVQLVTEMPDGHNAHALLINWQDGPRGLPDGSLAEPNGAFIEDVLYAAKQRLEFFQDSKYEHDANAAAIEHIDAALEALSNRTKERSARKVEGKHEI